jgi:broad specificity phosphatase PhoE
VKTIYLIRHGEIEGGKPRRFIGRTDLPLTAAGREQVGSLGRLLCTQNIERIVCSPLCRCQESGKLLGALRGVTIETEQKMSEIDLGDWDGLTVAEVKSMFPGEFELRGDNLAGYKTPRGESFNDLQARTWNGFAKIIETTKSQTVVVAHAGVNRVLLCKILGIPLGNMFRLDQDYACCNTLHVDEKGIRVGCLNRVADE